MCTLTTIVVVLTLGDEPKTAAEYFSALNSDRLTGILRMDFPSLINVLLYCIISFAIYTIFKNSKALLLTLLIFTGVALSLSNHSGLSIISLSDKYAVAATELEKNNIVIASEAVIASDWWNSTGGFLAGILMQGGMALLSVIMIKREGFSRVTAFSGLLANGLDFLHIFAGMISASAGITLISIGGLFYLVWFPMLGRDFFRLSKKISDTVH